VLVAAAVVALGLAFGTFSMDGGVPVSDLPAEFLLMTVLVALPLAVVAAVVVRLAMLDAGAGVRRFAARRRMR